MFVVPEVLDYGSSCSTGRVKIHVKHNSTHSVQIPAKSAIGELHKVDQVHSMQQTAFDDDGLGSIPASSPDNVHSVHDIDKVEFLKLFDLKEITDLTSVQLQQLEVLLYEFHDVFSKHDLDLGHTSLVKL